MDQKETEFYLVVQDSNHEVEMALICPPHSEETRSMEIIGKKKPIKKFLSLNRNLKQDNLTSWMEQEQLHMVTTNEKTLIDLFKEMELEWEHYIIKKESVPKDPKGIPKGS